MVVRHSEHTFSRVGPTRGRVAFTKRPINGKRMPGTSREDVVEAICRPKGAPPFGDTMEPLFFVLGVFIGLGIGALIF